MNFVSFTPGTSFDMKSNLGIGHERAILYCLLERAWGIRNRDSAISVLAGNMNIEGFKSLVRWVQQNQKIDSTLSEAFTQMAAEAIDLRERFNWLRGRLGAETWSDEVSHERNLWVGEMRTLLARSCLSAPTGLDHPGRVPEIQTSPGQRGAAQRVERVGRRLFRYAPARVLLLSATPYKMYTLSHEADTDDHYKDFVQTLRFLDPSRPSSRNSYGTGEGNSFA